MIQPVALSKKQRPFLKWAGGKFRLVDKIRQRLPAGGRLIEPFAGSGAVFLNTAYGSYLLGDINADLINCFCWIQQEKRTFIDFCRSFFDDRNNCKEAFVHLRTVFNTTTDKRLKAALFIYLNRHCFNGLMRYNQDGLFNTSFGQYIKPYFPEKEMQAFINKLHAVQFMCSDFMTIMNHAVEGDVVYCDPPYVPLSSTANFTSYHATQFGDSEHAMLASMAKQLAEKGIPVIISNHDTAFVRDLYAGAMITCFKVRRQISCGDRDMASEILACFNLT